VNIFYCYLLGIAVKNQTLKYALLLFFSQMITRIFFYVGKL